MNMQDSTIPPSVLVVDDDVVVRESLAAMLRSAGLTVAMASDGAEAVTLVGRQWFPVVITDRSMPTLDGIEFVQRLRAITVAPVYVIMLTASADAQEYERGYCAGVDHYVIKSGKEAELLSKVSGGFKAIRRRQLTSSAPGGGPIVVDLENGAHTPRHLIGRLNAEIAHARRSNTPLSILSACVEAGSAAHAGSSQAVSAAEALVRATLTSLRPHLDWTARLPIGNKACKIAVVMPQAAEPAVAMLEQSIRNAFVGTSQTSAWRLTFGAVSLRHEDSNITAMSLLGDAERRRRPDSAPAGHLGAVQGY
jgi:CheY-like chemotaxis protein